MPFTQGNLIALSQTIGFREIRIRSPEPGTVEITISGIGRFRRLEPMAITLFQQIKPITVKVRIVRKFFGFRLWEIEL